jgi:replicative DNA helicase
MRKELGQVRQKKKKLLEKKALIDEQLELLSLREEELENEEVIIVFREANITLEEVMEQFKQLKQEKKEKRTYEKNMED